MQPCRRGVALIINLPIILGKESTDEDNEQYSYFHASNQVFIMKWIHTISWTYICNNIYILYNDTDIFAFYSLLIVQIKTQVRNIIKDRKRPRIAS